MVRHQQRFGSFFASPPFPGQALGFSPELFAAVTEFIVEAYKSEPFNAADGAAEGSMCVGVES